jgi:hypothetical protein
VIFTIDVKDGVSSSIVSNVDVSICDRGDLSCARPLAQGRTDSSGRVVLRVQQLQNLNNNYLGLDGYVELTSPDIVSWRFYWGFPLSEAEFKLIDVPNFFTNAIRVLTPAELTQQSSSLGLGPFDQKTVYLSAGPRDCEWRLGSLQVTTNPTSPDVKEVYGIDPAATATDPNATFGGFVFMSNVPLGSVEVIATPVATPGKPSSRQSVTTRAGWWTYIPLVPTPQ